MFKITKSVGIILTCFLILASTQSSGNIKDNYVGCYEAVNDQTGLQKVTLQNKTPLTLELCIGQCRLQHSTYAGLENSRDCLCGNNFGVNVPDTSCNSLCPGNQSEYCGGSNGKRNFYSLYTVCKMGYYGNACDKVCHCKREAPCDRMTGKCPNGCEGKWFGFTCSEVQLAEKYIGCFLDNKTRAIPSELYTNQDMTIEFCLNMCKLRGNSIAGLQFSSYCFCGESYDRYGPRNERDCNMTCSGNPSQKCGGVWANSVYSVCPPGYYGPKCHNRCHCYNNSRCVYLTGECNSTCKAGWTGSSCNIRVNDILWCANDEDCMQNEVCSVIDLKYTAASRCRCRQGFQNMNKWDPCTDIDECKSGDSTCNAATAICVNNIGSYICECKSGFTKGSTNCEDIDECKSASFECDNETEVCQNTFGSYTCRCKSGYENTTFGNCTDIDECQLDSSLSLCNEYSECVNSIGDYGCMCKKDFICGKYDEWSISSTTGILLVTCLVVSLLINALFVAYLISSAKSRNSETGKAVTQSTFESSSKSESGQQENDYDENPGPVGQEGVYEEIIPKKRRVLLNPASQYAVLLKLDK